MRAIVRNSARCAALFCIAAAFACADAHDDVMDVVASMAGALTEVSGDAAGTVRGNVSKFMAAVSKDMPDYDTLKNNVTALVDEGEISSSVVPLTEDGDTQAYKIDLDWLLEVRSLEQDGPLVRRREVVHCELRKEKKHWKIIALKPLDFFAPAKLGQ
jgi:hypothetical protein